jgi:membrane-associated phospholipid phosphatase
MMMTTVVLILGLTSVDPITLGEPGTGWHTSEVGNGRGAEAFVVQPVVPGAGDGQNAVSSPVLADPAVQQGRPLGPVVDPQDARAVPTQTQQPEEDEKPPTPAHTGIQALFYGLFDDVKHLPSKPNLFIAAIGGGLAAGVHPVDTTLNERLLSHDTLVTNIWKPGHIVGNDFVQMGLAVSTFAYGRLTDAPKASHFGTDLLRAQIIAGVLTQGLKYAVGRERPNHTGDPAFPSGHAALTFATATVIERHLGWKMAGLGYAVAAYVSTSRLHDNVHYASDVVFGAAVGTISGRTVTQHGRNEWTFVAVRTTGGVAVTLVRTARPH